MAWTKDPELNGHPVQRTTRAHAKGPTWDRDVAVPAGQAALVTAGVTIGTVTLAIPVTIWAAWPWWAPPAAALAIGGVTFAASSVALVTDHRRLLWAIEETLTVDLNRDGAVGEPLDPEILRVELTRDNGRRMAYIDLPGSPDQLGALARGLLNGKGTSEATWTGAGAPFSRSEYAAIRAAMIERGLAAWTNPDHHAQGWEPTAAGRAILRKIADALPRGDDGPTRGGRGERVRACVRSPLVQPEHMC